MAKKLLYISAMLSQIHIKSICLVRYNAVHKQFLSFGLVIALLAGFKANCNAEEAGIGITAINYTLNSTHTIDLNYTITINAEVTNFDTSSFTGTLTFGLRNNHGIITNQDVFSRPPYSGNIITLKGHETIPAIFNVIISSQYFAPGPDVVVIWPIFSGTPHDSISIPINILDPSEVKSEKENPLTYIITRNSIILKNTSYQNNFKQVRLFNVMGQQLSQLTSDHITEIPLPSLPKGIYLCEFIAADGNKQVIKFIYPSTF